MKRSRSIIVACGAAALVALSFYLLSSRDPGQARGDEPASQAPAASAIAKPSSAAKAVSIPSSPQQSASEPRPPSELSEQELATGRMIAAHASLRAPSVDDPDSVENKRVMQAMISKALASRRKSAVASE